MPNASPRTSSQSASELVEAFLGALKALDMERALAMLGDDIVYQNYPLPPQRGKSSVRKTLRLTERVLTEFDVRMHHMAEQNGVVLTERTDILRGPLIDLVFWVCGTFEVRNGKIVLWRDRFDVGTFMLQLATSPLRSLLSARLP